VLDEILDSLEITVIAQRSVMGYQVLKFEGLAQTGFGIASREIPRGAV